MRNALAVSRSPISLPFFAELKLFTVNSLTIPDLSPNTERYILTTWGALVTSLLRFSVSSEKEHISVACNEVAQLILEKKLYWCTAEDEDEVVQFIVKIKDLENELTYFPDLVRLNKFAEFIDGFGRVFGSRIQEMLKAQTNEVRNKCVLQCALLVSILNLLLKKRFSICDASTSDVDERISKMLCEGVVSCAGLLYLNESMPKLTPLDALKIAFINSLQTIVDRMLLGGNTTLLSFDDDQHAVPFVLCFPPQMQKYFASVPPSNSVNTPASVFLYYTFVHLFLTLEKELNKGSEENERVVPFALKFFDHLIELPGCFVFVTKKFPLLEFIMDGSKTIQTFPFLTQDTPYREIWYKAIGSLIYNDELQDKYWETFFYNYEASLNKLLSVNTLDCKIAVGQMMLSDMIGLAKAVPNIYAYNDFFDWYHSRVFPVVAGIVQEAGTANVLFPSETFTMRVLKLYEKLTRNSMHTHMFKCSSPIPVTLCRDVTWIESVLLPKACTFMASFPRDNKKVYESAMKSVKHSLSIFCNLIEGKYVNVNAFDVFGDKSFSEYISGLLSLAFSLPIKEYENFHSFNSLLFNFIDDLCSSQSEKLLGQTFPALSFLLRALKTGCESDAFNVTSSSFTAISSLLTCYHRETMRKVKTPLYENFSKFLQLPQTVKIIKELFTILLKVFSFFLSLFLFLFLFSFLFLFFFK